MSHEETQSRTGQRYDDDGYDEGTGATGCSHMLLFVFVYLRKCVGEVKTK